MKISTINTDSTGYLAFRKVFGTVTGIGAGIALESVVIPCVKVIWKSKLIKAASVAGTVVCAYQIVEPASKWAEEYVDVLADGWNAIAELTNMIFFNPVKEEATVEEAVEKINDVHKNDTPATGVIFTNVDELLPMLNDDIARHESFTFENEEDAKHLIEYLTTAINEHGYTSVADALNFEHSIGIKISPWEVRGSSCYGWTADDIPEWGVEKIQENEYVATVFNYHDITSTFVLLSDAGVEWRPFTIK